MKLLYVYVFGVPIFSLCSRPLILGILPCSVIPIPRGGHLEGVWFQSQKDLELIQSLIGFVILRFLSLLSLKFPDLPHKVVVRNKWDDLYGNNLAGHVEIWFLRLCNFLLLPSSLFLLPSSLPSYPLTPFTAPPDSLLYFPLPLPISLYPSQLTISPLHFSFPSTLLSLLTSPFSLLLLSPTHFLFSLFSFSYFSPPPLSSPLFRL